MHRPKIFSYSSYLSMTLKVLPISCRKGRQVQILTPFSLQRPVWLKPHTMRSHCSSLDASAQTDKYFCFCEPCREKFAKHHIVAGYLISDTHQGSWPSPINRNWQERADKFKQGFNGAPVPLSMCEAVISFLIWGQARGWLRWFAHLSVMLSAGGIAVVCFCSDTQVFAPSFSEMTVGFFGLYHLGPEFAPTAQLFLVPYNFFVFFSWWGGVFRCKLCSTAAKSPRPVSKSKKASTGCTLYLLWGLRTASGTSYLKTPSYTVGGNVN